MFSVISHKSIENGNVFNVFSIRMYVFMRALLTFLLMFSSLDFNDIYVVGPGTSRRPCFGLRERRAAMSWTPGANGVTFSSFLVRGI